MSTAAVVPAAGKGARFGGAKLLADVDGDPLLVRTIRCLLDGGIDRVIVVVEAGGAVEQASTGHAVFADTRVRLVPNPEPERGMFSSIQVGLAAADADRVLVLPGDMPFVRPDTVAAVVDAARTRPGTVVSPRHGGRRGHPIALPATICRAVQGAESASNLKTVLDRLAPPREALNVDDPGVLRDVDVAGDLDGSSGTSAP
jgi:molybdenum cofactor cytidylyltransferase